MVDPCLEPMESWWLEIPIRCSMLYPSGLAYGPGEKADPQQQTRTSKGTFVSSGMDPDGVLSWVEERIAAVTLIPRENGEVRSVLWRASTTTCFLIFGRLCRHSMSWNIWTSNIMTLTWVRDLTMKCPIKLWKTLLALTRTQDTFDPKIFGPQPSQRAATVLVYLSDVEAGGETVFKKEGIDGELHRSDNWWARTHFT